MQIDNGVDGVQGAPGADPSTVATRNQFLASPKAVESLGVVSEVGAFARMRGEWARLHEESDAGVFNAWEWLYPWLRRIAPERSPLILTARDASGELLGL